MRRSWALVVSIALAVPVACSGQVSSQPAIELHVFAAASLGPALAAAKDAYLSSLKTAIGSPAIAITITTDSSAALRTQIEQGAPADVFLSADTTNPQLLVDHDIADGVPVPFAGNSLVIIVPKDNPAAITTAADLARAGVRIIAAGDEVPITTYATQVVENLSALDGYPSGFGEAYESNVVSREENVAAVVAKIELGEGDAAIVYVTDAMTSSDVATIEIPEGANVRATYAGVVIGDITDIPNQVERARSFLDWLAGPGGLAVLAEFGFQPPQ